MSLSLDFLIRTARSLGKELHFKAETGGVNTMCELMEKFGERKMEEGRMEGRLEGRAEGRMEGRAEGRMESAGRTATALLALGKLTLSQIAEATQLSLDEVERLAGSTGA